MTSGTRTPRSSFDRREPIHVVAQRLGHASPVVTMTVYAHVLPGSQREAADLFARLIGEAGA
jgi:integrase